MNPRTSTAVLVAAAAAGLGGLAASWPASAAPRPVARRPVARRPAAASSGALGWRACGDLGARCASLRVPRDWSDPDGPTIEVGLTRLAARDPRHSLGVLFFNPGGPGGETRDIVERYATRYFPAVLRRRFEIVGVDPRGTPPTVPAVRCGLPTRAAGITEAPRSRTGYERLLAYDRRVGRSCLRRTGPLLRDVDTVSAARDLDAARVALGVAKVSWLGVSYGSLLGQTYAHLFPSHLRAAVLDGALDHAVGPARLALDEARSTDGEFRQLARWCAADRHCALHGRDLIALYRGLLRRATARPIPAHGFPQGATADQIGFGTYDLLEIRRLWPRIAAGIAAATGSHPDASGLARFGGPEDASYRATTCEDLPTDIDSYATFRRRLRALWRAAPITGPFVEGWDVDTGCMGWPVRARNPWGPVAVTGTPPLLVVGGAHDPSTPQPWARGMARQIAGSELLLWSGCGHTGYFNDPSVRAREIRYLLDPGRAVPGAIAGR